jgi:hypothetical protein
MKTNLCIRGKKAPLSHRKKIQIILSKRMMKKGPYVIQIPPMKLRRKALQKAPAVFDFINKKSTPELTR